MLNHKSSKLFTYYRDLAWSSWWWRDYVRMSNFHSCCPLFRAYFSLLVLVILFNWYRHIEWIHQEYGTLKFYAIWTNWWCTIRVSKKQSGEYWFVLKWSKCSCACNDLAHYRKLPLTSSRIWRVGSNGRSIRTKKQSVLQFCEQKAKSTSVFYDDNTLQIVARRAKWRSCFEYLFLRDTNVSRSIMLLSFDKSNSSPTLQASRTVVRTCSQWWNGGFWLQFVLCWSKSRHNISTESVSI